MAGRPPCCFVLLLPMAATFLYRCPSAGQTAQGWSAEEINDDENAYELVACLACTQMHHVNLKTGKVLGLEDRFSSSGSLAMLAAMRRPSKYIQRSSRRAALNR